MKNNEVFLVGTIVSNIEFVRDFLFTFKISVLRTSGTPDTINVFVLSETANFDEFQKGDYVSINGQFKSFNRNDGEKSRLVLYVFAESLKKENLLPLGDTNEVYISGFICKKPIFRETPKGRKITDFMVAINNEDGESYYAPCITWGKAAQYTRKLSVGDKVSIKGRFQSRIYNKILENGEIEERTAYEISVSQFRKESEEK